MSDKNHVDRIKAEQRELLKQFEQSLQENFKHLMNNVPKQIRIKYSSDVNEEDESDNDEGSDGLSEDNNHNKLNANRYKNEAKDDYTSSESEDLEDRGRKQRKMPVDDESRSNSEVEMVSKFSDNHKNTPMCSDEEDSIKNYKDSRPPVKAIKSKTQNEFNRQPCIQNTINEAALTFGSKKQAINNNTTKPPINRAKTPQPVVNVRTGGQPPKNISSGAKSKTKYDSNKSGAFSTANNGQKDRFISLKLSTSINKKTKISVLSAYSNKEEKSGNYYKVKYHQIMDAYSDMKSKFTSLYDKHQRLLKLFNKLDLKYRLQTEKITSTNNYQPNTRLSATKVTVPKTMCRPDSAKKPGNLNRRN